jgi:hypothetical protein
MDNFISFDYFLNKEFDFYGVDGNCFKLDDFIYEAIEDDEDGYRSHLEGLEDVTNKYNNLVFFKTPIAKVKCVIMDDEYCDTFKGIHFIDNNNHVWLKVGTDHSDDYYPWFVFQYEP